MKPLMSSTFLKNSWNFLQPDPPEYQPDETTNRPSLPFLVVSRLSFVSVDFTGIVSVLKNQDRY